MGEIKLGVNIDHVATLRQARRVAYPDIVAAADAAERGGADGITIHLREDRRHIQDADVDRLAPHVRSKLNLEIAAIDEMLAIALRVVPRDICLVPERRQEVTTEGGLEVAGQVESLRRIVSPMRDKGIHVSLFIDPDARQIEATLAAGADVVELHTGAYAEAPAGAARAQELLRLQNAARVAAAAGLLVNAGHGLTLENVAPIAAIPEVYELNIGHSLVADALFVGLESAVRRMKEHLVAVRAGVA